MFPDQFTVSDCGTVIVSFDVCAVDVSRRPLFCHVPEPTHSPAGVTTSADAGRAEALNARRTTAPPSAATDASPGRRFAAPEIPRGRPRPRPPNPTIRMAHPRLAVLPVGHGAEYPGPC